MKRFPRAALLLSILLAATAAAGHAYAATPINPAAPTAGGSASASGTPVPSDAPLASGDIAVQVGVDDQQGVLIAIVSVKVPDSVALPVRVRVPVPVGATTQWAGEVLGADPSADPQRDYTLKSGEGAQYAEFVLSQGHQGQIDTFMPAVTSGDPISAKATFVQSVPSSVTAFAVRMPAGAGNVRTEPAAVGAPEFNSAGESLYVLPAKNMAAGEKTEISISYTKGAASSSTAPSGSSGWTPLIVLLSGVIVVILAVAASIARRPGGGEGSRDDTLVGDDEGEDALIVEDEDESRVTGDDDAGEDGTPAGGPGGTARPDAQSDDPFSDAGS